jgi:predicted AAA+ superfamily ATPase
LRAEIRARLKDGTLYAEEESSDWQRTAEVYWQKDGKTGVFNPLRYEKRWDTEDLSEAFGKLRTKKSKPAETSQ